MTISGLGKEFQVKFSEIESALEHVEKSVKPRKIKIRPAGCRQCGFVFKDRTKFIPPSRCPKCKSEWIEEAAFKIE